MKKTVLVLLSILILSSAVSSVIAKPAVTNPATASAIKAYKSGDYTQAYTKLQKIVKDEPNNALAMYYLAMTNVQLGNKQDAITLYQQVALLSPNGVLGSYAKKGQKCIEYPLKCNEPDEKSSASMDTEEDKFIKGAFGSGFSKEARGAYEKEKIESIKRRINRKEELTPSQFKDYKDFSSEVPTNDEIVSAIRTLQRAGLSDVINNNGYNGMSGIFGSDRVSNKSEYEMLNLLLGQNKRGISNLNPQVIQSLLTTQMTSSF